jgi:hypothetical protein
MVAVSGRGIATATQRCKNTRRSARAENRRSFVYTGLEGWMRRNNARGKRGVGVVITQL